MKLTFTKLDTYRKCPLRYRLRYREKLPEVSMGGRNLSLVLHQTLRTFLLNARRDTSLEALLRAYKALCPLPQSPKQEQRYAEGRNVLEAFHWQEGARLSSAVALEQKFSVIVGGDRGNRPAGLRHGDGRRVGAAGLQVHQGCPRNY